MTIILEKDDNIFWAWIEDCPEEFSGIHTSGSDEKEVTENVRALINNLLANEFKDNPKFIDFDTNAIIFNYRYSLMDFFETYSDIKIGSIAKRAGLNASLVRQYASGIATASATQAKKIQEAVHSLAQSLLQVSVV